MKLKTVHYKTLNILFNYLLDNGKGWEGWEGWEKAEVK